MKEHTLSEVLWSKLFSRLCEVGGIYIGQSEKLQRFMEGVGRYQEALQQATWIAKEAGKSHSQHFNLGQIFWLCGDPERGKYHLGLALAYARDDQERQDVTQILAYLRGRSEHGSL